MVLIEEYMSKSRKRAEDFLSQWFFDAPISKIRRQDAEDFMAWSVFSRRRHELGEEEVCQISELLTRVEAKVGLTWNADDEEAPPGHQYSSQKFAAHTWETDTGYNHWPLIMYAGIFFMRTFVGNPCLRLLGFRLKKQGGLRYWLREREWCSRRSNSRDKQEGLVFFHGISPGLVVYIQFLMRFRHQTVILVELPWVTFNPFNTTVPSYDDFCDDVVDILDANCISKACLSGHSYGSFMIAWLLSFPRMSGRITRVVLCSAPALNLFIAKTCKIVCYDKPFWFEYCLASIFFRQFYWHQCVLTAADLPKGSTVVLVEHDELVPVPEIVQECADHGVRCHVVPRTTHGFEMIFPIPCARVVQFIRQGHGEPLKNDDGVGLFFHGARSSKLYGWFSDLSLRALDALVGPFVMRGHSPFNMQVLSYMDELWPGGRKSFSADNLMALVRSSEGEAEKAKSE
eukprot:TRINITY_DN18534_c0_g1_i1.p1 TRINITY_DN18534_c0_g1~~TRINITY_DN18534_c0_g1_i1.p1  ORF type:complete len:519 (-),score=52.16 TRINITY_DN18534_c0_g1_i1:169-1539(-)